MANYKKADANQLDAKLTEVADAIRERTGKTEPLDFLRGDFESAVQSISGGEDSLAQFANGTLTEYTSDKVTEMINYAFARNPNLVKVNLPNWTKGGAYAFQSCTGLKEVVCPKLQIGQEALFFDCASLERVEFGAMAYIGSNLFKNCTALTTVIIGNEDQLPTLGSTNVFTNTPIATSENTGFVYVPSNLVDRYKAASNWSTYASKIKSIDELP